MRGMNRSEKKEGTQSARFRDQDVCFKEGGVADQLGHRMRPDSTMAGREMRIEAPDAAEKKEIRDEEDGGVGCHRADHTGEKKERPIKKTLT